MLYKMKELRCELFALRQHTPRYIIRNMFISFLTFLSPQEFNFKKKHLTMINCGKISDTFTPFLGDEGTEISFFLKEIPSDYYRASSDLPTGNNQWIMDKNVGVQYEKLWVTSFAAAPEEEPLSAGQLNRSLKLQ